MRTDIYADKNYIIGETDPRLFGSFVEHMGRVIYTGIYQPGHESADEDGFRMDTMKAVREMGVTAVRYPGGNYSSCYRWEDGIGPVSDRPQRLDLAWRSVETNEFGTHEFVRWTEKTSVSPIFTVNLGTRGIREAVDYLEYCNFPGGTTLSDARIANGAQQPFGIKTWCLGNEMDGAWQIGHKTAHEYGRLAAETGKAMKAVDPDLELIVCGSSLDSMETCPKWDLEVLDQTYEVADYLALHQYYGGQEKGTRAFLAQSLDFEEHIHTIRSVVDVVRRMHRSSRRVRLSVDEWGVWSRPANSVNDEVDRKPWQKAPAISEQIYTLEDALLFASMQMAILRNCDVISIACQSLLTNISACIMTEKEGGVWLQPNYYPFMLLAKYGQGNVLESKSCGDGYRLSENDRYVPYLDQLIVWNEGKGETAVFFVNRAPKQLTVHGSVCGFSFGKVLDAQVMTAEDRLATNEKNHDLVRTVKLEGVSVKDGEWSLVLPAYSFAMIRLATCEE